MYLYFFHAQLEVKCQQIQEQAEKRELELNDEVSSLEDARTQAENQMREMKEAIFELEDQVEQQRAVNCHTNQAVLDMESELGGASTKTHSSSI